MIQHRFANRIFRMAGRISFSSQQCLLIDRHLDAALAVFECDGKCLDVMAIMCELHAHNL